MTPRDSEISTPPEIAVVTHFHERQSTKTIPVFLHADGEASWSLLPSSVFLLSGGTVQSENTYSCILKVTCKVWESPKISPKVLSHPDDQSFTRFGCCVFMTKLAFNFFNELCFNYQSQWTIVNFDITRHWNFSHFRMEFSSNTKFVFLFFYWWLLIFLYFCEKWR